jgi:hypothetical protein
VWPRRQLESQRRYERRIVQVRILPGLPSFACGSISQWADNRTLNPETGVRITVEPPNFGPVSQWQTTCLLSRIPGFDSPRAHQVEHPWLNGKQRFPKPSRRRSSKFGQSGFESRRVLHFACVVQRRGHFAPNEEIRVELPARAPYDTIWPRIYTDTHGYVQTSLSNPFQSVAGFLIF